MAIKALTPPLSLLTSPPSHCSTHPHSSSILSTPPPSPLTPHPSILSYHPNSTIPPTLSTLSHDSTHPYFSSIPSTPPTPPPSPLTPLPPLPTGSLLSVHDGSPAAGPGRGSGRAGWHREDRVREGPCQGTGQAVRCLQLLRGHRLQGDI